MFVDIKTSNHYNEFELPYYKKEAISGHLFITKCRKGTSIMSKEDYYKTYIFEYPYNGARWAFELMASSPEDAEARFKALAWGKYSGELKFRTNVPNPSFFIKLWNWFKGGSVGHQ